MNRSLLALTIVASALLPSCDKPKTESVTSAMLAEVPPRESLVVDLTRADTIYKFADDIDISRVSVRTEAGVRPLSERLPRPNARTGGLVLGSYADLKDQLPATPVGPVRYDCGILCKCDDGADCAELERDKKCIDSLTCEIEMMTCICVAKP